MSALQLEEHNALFVITFNRIEKHNAFDEKMLREIKDAIVFANQKVTIRALLIKANGNHFSAGADLAWMQRVATLSEAENKTDALILADMMHSLYLSEKPTIAMVHGSAFGGGAGIVAAVDVAICGMSSRFCFSEVKLGLIPAVISPYVIRAIGARAATELFMSARTIDAQRAYEMGIIHHCVPDETLLSFTQDYIKTLIDYPPMAIHAAKHLVRDIEGRPIDTELKILTAEKIAAQRVSIEGQKELNAFLNRKTPKRDE